jgi:hypothetical protein
MPEYKQPFSNGVMGLFLSLLDSLLENRHLHFKLIDLVFQKEDFLVFGVGGHGRKAFEAFRLRTLPENRAAMMAASMINVTAWVMMSRFLSIKLIQSPLKYANTFFESVIVA